MVLGERGTFGRRRGPDRGAQRLREGDRLLPSVAPSDRRAVDQDRGGRTPHVVGKLAQSRGIGRDAGGDRPHDGGAVARLIPIVEREREVHRPRGWL